MMPRPEHFKKHWRGFALLVSFWTIVALIFAAAGFYNRLMEGETLSFSTVVWWIMGMYLWIPATLIVVWLVRMFPIRMSTWYRTVPVHAVAAVVNSFIMAGLHTGIRYGWHALVLDSTFDFVVTMNRMFSGSLGVDCMLYLTILAGIHAFAYHNENQRRMLEATLKFRKPKDAITSTFFVQRLPYYIDADPAAAGRGSHQHGCRIGYPAQACTRQCL